MHSLWTPNKDYTTLNPTEHGIGLVFTDYSKLLPYHREYSLLTKEELTDLLKAAKENHWQALDLSSCALEELPDELWELTDLRLLYLGNRVQTEETNENLNCFKTIPQNIEKLHNLQVLSLLNLHCTIDKDSPLDLPNLHYLEIWGCGFPQIPDALLIPSIDHLSYNCLEGRLSSNIARLSNLAVAYFGFSHFTSLPNNIDQLSKLRVISLYGSKVSSLPSSMMNMRNLILLDIKNTPLAYSLPPEIIEQPAQELIRYIIRNEQSRARKEFFNEGKMIIVGQGSVGKTSILKRLIDDTFSETQSTDGINFETWDYEWDKKNVRLNIWDFGGQEIYHSTHQFFLTKRSLYLLVWDAFAEVEYGRVDYWLKTIRSLAGDSPIIIVVNKCDKDNGPIIPLDEKEIMDNYKPIAGIINISCKDNINIDKLRNLIKRTAAELPLMQVKWLKSWMNVRRQIENEVKENRKETITYYDYLDICKQNEITDEKEALSLIMYLHDLGIVFYYHDDPLLKELVILSSEWGTDAVYKILDEKEGKLKGKNGVLSVNDLPSIWTDQKKYPPQCYSRLLNLLERFQLALKIDQDTYLVTELLSNQIIDSDWDFCKSKALSFRYQYDFLPAGIMTKFIVSANSLLVTKEGIKQCWKKGAYLSRNTAIASVRLFDYISERYIQIDVIGEAPRDKTELLFLIRITLNKINSRYNNLNISQKIPCCCSEECEFLFDYKNLLDAENKGVPNVQCHSSWQHVQLSRLLNGIESMPPKESGIYNYFFVHQGSVDAISNLLSGSIAGSTVSPVPPLPALAPFSVPSCENINDQLVAWSLSSPIYKTVVGESNKKNTDDWLKKALCGDESERISNSYNLMVEIWRNHPEWGLMPDYVLLSKFEHTGKYYKKYRDHTAHMFKVMLLGLYFYENSKVIRSAFENKGITQSEFIDVWSIAALYHDIGYVFDTLDSACDSETTQSACNELLNVLDHPFHQLYGDSFGITVEKDMQSKHNCNPPSQLLFAQLEEQLKDFKGFGDSMGLCIKSEEEFNPISEYFNIVAHPNKTRTYYDHGINSAIILLFMQKSLSNYVSAVHNALNDPSGIKAHPMPSELVSKINDIYSSLSKIADLSIKAAKALSVHNITKIFSPVFLQNLRYKEVSIESFKIPLDEEPFAYLLRVCDELQCWDRQYMASSITTGEYLKGEKVSIATNGSHPRLYVNDDKERQKIITALNNIIDPPIAEWLDT